MAGAGDGSCPAWAQPYDQYQAIEAAVSVTGPGLAQVFYVAAACDLFLTTLLKGDAETEDAALAALRGEHASMAWSLLTWAVTDVLDGKPSEYLTAPSSAPLLPVEVLSELAGLYVTVLIDGCGCPGTTRCRRRRLDQVKLNSASERGERARQTPTCICSLSSPGPGRPALQAGHPRQARAHTAVDVRCGCTFVLYRPSSDR